MQRIFLSVVVSLLLAAPVGASCGSSSCPLDTHALNQPERGHFTFDFSFQYIDQNQPRIGTRSAQIGELHADHDEVRTLNRIATGTLTYAATDRLQFGLAVPFVSRMHEHLASNHAHGFTPAAEHNVVPESWDIQGVGDVTLHARYALTPTVWALGGVKLPTGNDERANDDGEIGELPIQAGSGTTDGLIGLAYQSHAIRSTRAGYSLAPYFASASYTFRTGDARGYRMGNELQLNAGGAYPLGRTFDLLVQLNARSRTKDRIADEPEEAEFTGGKALYITPGIRVSAGTAGVYALVQLPLYQDVNALQLTARRNWIIGVQTRF
ncbi:MAG TPA: hypothetical protein VFN10_18130 [Thermoanaerobaculia bacterium]|nr:hypothetical protein [Thermoanaerobaculia bacterium]